MIQCSLFNSSGNQIWTYCLFIAATFLFFLSVLYGLDFTDSFYHLNQALSPAEGKHLYPFLGSSLIIREIVNFLGPEIIYLRLFNSFLLVSSFFLPFFAIQIKKSKRELLFLISLGLILFLPFTPNILGYDTLSIFFLSLIFSLCINYYRYPGFFKLLWISLVCSLAVLVRLPNAVVIPIVALNFLFLQEGRSKNFSGWTTPILFFFTAVVGTFLGYFLYYDGWNDFLSSSANTNSHFVVELLKNYLRDGIQVILLMCFLLILYFTYGKLKNKYSDSFLNTLFLCCFLSVVSFFLLPTKYSFNYSIFIFALVLTYLCIELYQWKKNTILQNKIYVLYFCFLFINALGSNTGLLKGYSLFVIFPFILSLGEFGFMKKYWLMILIFLVPFSFLNKIYGIYEDKNLLFLSEVPQNDLLYSIRTSDARKYYLDQIDDQVKILRAENFQVYFYGDKSHIFNYLYPVNSFGISSFFQPVDEPMFFSQVKKEFQEKDGKNIAVFVVDSYPGTEGFDYSLFEKMLVGENFKRKGRSPIRLYLRRN